MPNHLFAQAEPNVIIMLDKLQSALRLAWAAKTSTDPSGWSKQNPAWGQSAATACLLQKLCGGEMMWALATLPDGSRKEHFYNALPHGSVVDLTRQQYPSGTKFSEGLTSKKDYKSVRHYALSLEGMADKLVALKTRVELARTRNVA